MKKSRFAFLIVFVGVLFSSMAYAMFSRTFFEAFSIIQIIENPAAKETSKPIQPHKQILHLDVIEGALIELKMLSGNESGREKQKIISGLRGRLKVIEGTAGKVTISARHEDPGMAASIANEIAEAYEKSSVGQNSENLEEAEMFLYRKIKLAQRNINQLESKITSLKKQFSSNESKTAIAYQIASLEEKRAAVKLTYTSKHPEVMSLEEELRRLREKRETLPERSEIDELKRALKKAEAEYRNLIREKELAKLEGAKEVGRVRLLQAAQIPQSPVGPSRGMIILLGALMGLLLGGIVALLIPKKS